MNGWPLALLAIAAVVLVYFLQNILVPFVLAGGVAYVLSPLIKWLHQRLSLPRWTVAVGLYLIIVAIAGGGAWWANTKVRAHEHVFSGDFPQQLHHLVVRLCRGEQAEVFGLPINAQAVTNKILALHAKFMEQGGEAQIARFIFDVVFVAILFFVLLFYFLLQGPDLLAKMLGLAPPENRPGLRALAAQIHPILLRYICGLFVIVLFTAFVTWIGIGPVFHLPYAVILSLLTGVLELVPIVGPTASATLLGGVAVLHGGNIWTLLGFALFCFAVRFVVDQIVGPIVLGRAVRLPPVAIIFAFLAGGCLFGLLGVLVAIPLLAICKIILDNYYALPVE